MKLARVSAALTLALVAASCGQILDIQEVERTLSGGQGGGAGLGLAGTEPAAGRSGDGGSQSHSGAHSGGRPAAGSTGQSGSVAGTDAGAGGEGGEGNGGTGGSKSLCPTYCEEVTTYCNTDALRQYADRDQCLLICGLFPQGELGETAGNTVGCRLGVARTLKNKGTLERAADCGRAGPSGGERCGTPCQAYCTITMQVCTEETVDPYYFESEARCLESCAGSEPSSFSFSRERDAAPDLGDTVSCRIFHAMSSALPQDATEHCDHAIGAVWCVDPPE